MVLLPSILPSNQTKRPGMHHVVYSLLFQLSFPLRYRILNHPGGWGRWLEDEVIACPDLFAATMRGLEMRQDALEN